MKLFCECNSEWISGQSSDPRFRFQSVQFIPKDDRMSCNICGYNCWIEPHYENMMFDLRRMNQC